MTKSELLAILAQFPDGQLVLVETPHGFDAPTVYVAAVRPRRADEFGDVLAGEYVAPGPGEPICGAVVLGTTAGVLRPL